MYFKKTSIIDTIKTKLDATYEGLDVEEEHADNAMAGLIQTEEVHDSIL